MKSLKYKNIQIHTTYTALFKHKKSNLNTAAFLFTDKDKIN